MVDLAAGLELVEGPAVTPAEERRSRLLVHDLARYRNRSSNGLASQSASSPVCSFT